MNFLLFQPGSMELTVPKGLSCSVQPEEILYAGYGSKTSKPRNKTFLARHKPLALSPASPRPAPKKFSSRSKMRSLFHA